MKAIHNQKESTGFYKKAQELLQNLVIFYAPGSEMKTEEEAYNLLKTYTTESYANLWKETHQKLQMVQYAGVSKENLSLILNDCEELVKQIK